MEEEQLDPRIIIPNRHRTPDHSGIDKTVLFGGVLAAIVVGWAVFASIAETQKPTDERNGWYTWISDYAVEKHKKRNGKY